MEFYWAEQVAQAPGDRIVDSSEFEQALKTAIVPRIFPDPTAYNPPAALQSAAMELYGTFVRSLAFSRPDDIRQKMKDLNVDTPVDPGEYLEERQAKFLSLKWEKMTTSPQIAFYDAGMITPPESAKQIVGALKETYAGTPHLHIAQMYFPVVGHDGNEANICFFLASVDSSSVTFPAGFSTDYLYSRQPVNAAPE